MVMKGYSAFPKYLASLKPHHKIFSVINQDTGLVGVLPLYRDAVSVFSSPNRLGQQDTYWESLIPLQRYSPYIQQPQRTTPPGHSLGCGGCVTPLQKCSLCILLPKSTGPAGHSLRESLLSAEMQSVYAESPPGFSLELSYPSTEMYSCI